MSLSSMMSMCAAMSGGCELRARWRKRRPESEMNRCAPVCGGFGSHRASVSLDDAPGDCKPHACAVELGFGVHALEQSEQLARVFHVEPYAVVCDEVGIPAALAASTDFDTGFRCRATELE